MFDVDDCVGAYDECGICNGDGQTCAPPSNMQINTSYIDITAIGGGLYEVPYSLDTTTENGTSYRPPPIAVMSIYEVLICMFEGGAQV
jgi:hypothetical protein